MKAVAFAGPSIVGLEPSQWPRVTLLPPASAGDVAKAAAGGAELIGIIDGYFETQRAVWHKEIIWAIRRGAEVFGAASMGALRAAELHTLGMIGFGRVFELFRDGVLHDDDEVALIHGPPEAGHIGLSEAMVNVRHAVEQGRREGVFTHDEVLAITSCAKNIFYKQRSIETITEALSTAGSPGLSERFGGYWRSNRFDVKRDDAAGLLSELDKLARSEDVSPQSASPEKASTNSEKSRTTDFPITEQFEALMHERSIPIHARNS